MKKIILFLFAMGFLIQAQSQCAYTYSVTGNTANFTHLWPIVGIQSLDSIHFDYGDATSATYVVPVPSTSSHTYPGPGTYFTCLTRYISSLNQPNQSIICIYCDTVTIAGNPTSCFASVSTVVSGSTATASGSASGGNPPYSYSYTLFPLNITNTTGVFTGLANGSYAVCVTATDAQNNVCTACDSFVVGGTTGPCIATSNFTENISGLNVAFTNTTNCPTCTSTSSYWTFGDGGTSNLANPNHSYTVSGTYTVCLVTTAFTANTITCVDSFCKQITVSGSSTGCFASLTHTMSGNTATFVPTVTGGTAPYTYFYNYGDGNTGSSAVHTYANPGVYNACVTVTAANNISCTACDSIVVGGTNGPCFATSNFTENISGLNVAFTNTTNCPTCTSTSSYWTFGDGGTSNLANPNHSYAMSGTYTVCLVTTAMNANLVTCIDSFCKQITVSGSNSGCLASLTHSMSGNTATFVPTITGGTAPFTYFYNYGDGNNGTSATHTYATSGYYNACVTVTAANNVSCTACDSVFIIPNIGGCTATASYTESVAGLMVNFNNTSSCTGCVSTNYAWDFGDGGNSILASPSHTYATQGSYQVCLNVVGIDSNQSTCFDSTCKSITIVVSGLNDVRKNKLQVYPNPTSGNFTVLIPEGEEVETVYLEDLTGRLIYSKKALNVFKNQLLFDLSNNAKGIYLIKLQTNRQLYTSTIVNQE